MKIENLLKENNINYKSQYTFPDLKYIDYLKFDFGVLDNTGKLLYLIEYNGEQHYKFIKHFHRTIEKFEEYKTRDRLKQDYCKRNNISLLVVRYDEDIKKQIKLSAFFINRLLPHHLLLLVMDLFRNLYL